MTVNCVLSTRVGKVLVIAYWTVQILNYLLLVTQFAALLKFSLRLSLNGQIIMRGPPVTSTRMCSNLTCERGGAGD